MATASQQRKWREKKRLMEMAPAGSKPVDAVVWMAGDELVVSVWSPEKRGFLTGRYILRDL
jgi:NAD dependent epimerase/dehydratase family enzyme